MKLFLKTLSRGLLVCGLLFAVVLLTGCYSSPIDPVFSDNPQPAGSTDQNNAAPAVARFHVGDTVTVTLSGPPEEIPVHTEPIKEDGTITMPSIGHVQAAGKTAGELQNEIYGLYVPKYYQHLTVTVTTGDRVYYVTGEVKQPGRQLYVGQMTVTKAITTAGDFTDFANHKKVRLIRSNGQTVNVNCDKALQDPSLDLPVYPNDQIQVPRRIF
jgi:polysaccharide export outer membrane protein